MRFQPVPPRVAARSAADNTSHLLSGCITPTTSPGMTDRPIDLSDTSLRFLERSRRHRTSSTCMIVAGNLAAAVPECMGDGPAWCSSPSHTRPSTRGRTSGTSTIEGRLFDPDRGRRRSRLTRCAARPRSRSPSGQPTHRSLLISAPTAAGPRTYLIARTRSSLVFAAGIVLRALVPSSSTVGAVAGGPHAVHLSQLERAPTRYDLGT